MFHILCWGFLFVLPYLLRPSFGASHKLIEENRQYLKYLVMINRLLWVGLFYFNAFVIVPKVIYKRKFRTYIVILLVIFLALLLIDWAVFKILLGEVPYYPKNFFPLIFIPSSLSLP